MGVAAHAQPAPVDPAELAGVLDKQTAAVSSTWLDSADPRTRAWGAYLALRDRRTEAVPALLAMLANFTVTGDDATATDVDGHNAMLETLDALIQLGVQAPAADAARIYKEFPVQSLILLSRSQEDPAQTLLSIFKDEQRWPGAWLASGNLLLQRNAKGFAALVIEGLTVHAQVTVVDSGVGYGTGGSSCCGAASSPVSKIGWPPVGVYEFGGCGNTLAAGDTVLATGADPASYRRQVNTTYTTGGASGCNCLIDRDLVRQHYLTGMLSLPKDEPPVRVYISRAFLWRGPAEYTNDFSAFVAEQQAGFADLARRLGEHGLFGAEEVKTLRPALHIVLRDDRASREIALPDLGALPSNVVVERM